MKKFFFKYVLSILLGVVLVWLAFRNEDWAGFGERLKQVDLKLTIGYVIVFAISHVLRIMRWGALVRALGPLSWKSVFSAGSVGYMCISVFPLRLGEFVRPYLVRGEAGITASGALATVVVERVIDGLLFVALFFVFLGMLPALPADQPNHTIVDAVRLSAYLAGVVFGVALLVLIAANRKPEWTLNFLKRIGYHIHKGLTDKALGLLASFLEGLKVLPDKRRLGAFMIMTIIYWILQGLGLEMQAWACHIDDMTWTGAFAVLDVIVVGIMLPSGPGMTGTFELAVTAGIALLDLSPASIANVALFAIMLHVVQLGVQVAFGAFYFFTGKMRLGELVQATAAPRDVPPVEMESSGISKDD